MIFFQGRKLGGLDQAFFFFSEQEWPVAAVYISCGRAVLAAKK